MTRHGLCRLLQRHYFATELSPWWVPWRVKCRAWKVARDTDTSWGPRSGKPLQSTKLSTEVSQHGIVMVSQGNPQILTFIHLQCNDTGQTEAAVAGNAQPLGVRGARGQRRRPFGAGPGPRCPWYWWSVWLLLPYFWRSTCLNSPAPGGATGGRKASEPRKGGQNGP